MLGENIKLRVFQLAKEIIYTSCEYGFDPSDMSNMRAVNDAAERVMVRSLLYMTKARIGIVSILCNLGI